MLPTKIFLKWQYYVKTGAKLNLENPKGLDEKIQWLKVHYKKDILKQLVDKYEVREYIKKSIGEKYLIELIGLYNSVDEVPFDELPSQFVLKCTHGSGMTILCSDKTRIDWNSAKDKIRGWMKVNWYYYGREWAYRGIKPRIICETSILDKEGNPPLDYKFYCFHGEPRLIEIVKRRGEFGEYEQRNFYDLNWERFLVHDGSPKIEEEIHAPKNLDLMIELARSLSKEFLFVRVDLYSLNNKIVYFGELTFYPGRGLEPFQPREYEELFGSYLKLPIDK